MNYNTRELIKLYSKCTGNTNRQEIMKILGASPIFEEVKKGTNDCLNYEGYISNLLDIVDDIKSQGNYPPEIDCVCPDTIAAINRAHFHWMK
jgi:hypothetical protein